MRISLILSNGSPSIFVRCSISATVLIAALALAARSVWARGTRPAGAVREKG